MSAIWCWPQELGQPAASGGQNNVRYAFFAKQHRLLVEQDGKLTTYDSANHQINGIAQQQGASRTLTFDSQDGRVNLDELKQI